jgi:hypothetical protein
MELNLSETMKQIITVFLLILLPLIVLGIGLYFNYLNVWFYILVVTWFGLGVIFTSTIQ